METKELIDFYTGKDEIDLTPENIEKIAKERTLSEEAKKQLKEFATVGGRWNVKSNNVVFPQEWI